MDTTNSLKSLGAKVNTSMEHSQEENADLGLRLRTDSGVYHVNWDTEAAVTPHGQIAFFAQYLHTADLFSRWCSDCPLDYVSNNAPEVSDVLGTLLLSVLSGHTRYNHISSIYGDVVSAQVLGVDKTVSSDSARRALKRMNEASCAQWQQDHLRKTYESLLTKPYILDIDTSVKPLYGSQEGAVKGYNPKKPGRPSHSYHTYFVGTLRLVLDVEVHPGNESAALYTRPGFWRLMECLPPNLWPYLIRGDIGFGNEGMMTECENRGRKYLFKLKQTGNVKVLIRQLEGVSGDWSDAGDGWQGCKAKLKLDGWSKDRQLIVLRRCKRKRGEQKELVAHSDEQQQGEFAFVQLVTNGLEYEYAVLVTNLDAEILTIAQLYRDRSDCENVFDELKNHWGWAGFTTQDLKRSQIMARIIAQAYNWWTVYCRLATPQKHSEAITSRPMFFETIGRLVQSAGQRRIRLTSTNQRASQIQEVMTSVSRFLDKLCSTAAQLTAEQRWAAILSRAFAYFLKGNAVEAVSDGRQLLIAF